MNDRAIRIELPRITERRGLAELVVRPSVIDDDVREVFGWGYCHLLAMALHEATGWPLAVIERDAPGSGKWRWAHAGVVAPRSGRFVDIHGPRTTSEVISELRAAGHGGRYRRTDTKSFAQFGELIGLEDGSPAACWRTGLTEAGQSVTEGFARQLASAAGWDAGQHPEAGG